MDKIKKVSRFFKFFFILLFILFPIFHGWYWISNGHPVGSFEKPLKEFGFFWSFGMENSSLPDITTISSLQKFLGYLIDWIPLTFTLLALYFLIRLFRLYERCEIFSFASVRYIRNIGYTLLFKELFNPIYQILFTLTLSSSNPPGQRFISLSANLTDFFVLFGSLLILLISWIMNEGCKLQEEQMHTV